MLCNSNLGVILNQQFYSPPLINGVNFTSSEIESIRNSAKLLTLTFLTSNRCNFKCKYCYTNAGNAEDNEFTFDECKLVIDQARSLGAKTIWIPGAGEPMLDNNFYIDGEFPLIDYANDKGMSVTFFTNGCFMTSDITKKLASKNVSVVTKINSFNKQIQDYLVGRNGAFEKMQEGLHNLIEAGFNKTDITRLGINTVITNQNHNEILDIFRYCRLNSIIPYISVTLHAGRAKEHLELEIPQDRIRNLFKKALEIDQTEFGFTWFPSPPYMADQCKKLFYDIVVTSTGDVRFCPGINISIGNVRKKPLKLIMQESSLLSKIRNIKDHLKGKCSSCSNEYCSYGCRLEAYNGGDLFGEDASCWRSC